MMFRMFFYTCLCSLFMISCVNQGEQLIDDFGSFLNDVEAEYENYSDLEWANAQAEYEKFKIYALEEDVALSERQRERLDEYTRRFEKVVIKKDPINHIFDVIMN